MFLNLLSRACYIATLIITQSVCIRPTLRPTDWSTTHVCPSAARLLYTEQSCRERRCLLTCPKFGCMQSSTSVAICIRSEWSVPEVWFRKQYQNLRLIQWTGNKIVNE